MSPPHKERPGREATGATKTVDDEDQQSQAGYYDVAAAMRRRRAASYRLPPQAGRRDPLDLVPTPSAARCELSIVVDREREVALVSGWRDGETVAEAGHRPRWSPSGAGWCIDATAVGDVIATAVRQRRIVQVHDKAPRPFGVVS